MHVLDREDGAEIRHGVAAVVEDVHDGRNGKCGGEPRATQLGALTVLAVAVGARLHEYRSAMI